MRIQEFSCSFVFDNSWKMRVRVRSIPYKLYGILIVHPCFEPEIGGHPCPRLVRPVSAIFQKNHVRVRVRDHDFLDVRVRVRGHGCPCPPISALSNPWSGKLSIVRLHFFGFFFNPFVWTCHWTRSVLRINRHEIGISWQMLINNVNFSIFYQWHHISSCCEVIFQWL